ncbi:MAG: Uma2 family endonuclease, partial [Lachnospiraceae bacterium]
QPDVFVVCDRSKIIKRCTYGAPDLIVEILSPSTRKKDISIKLKKYIGAGVAEYWIVDPDKKTVVVYDFAHDELPAIYGFDAKVPVGLFDGECEVDFAEIFEYISFLYD